MATLKEDIKAQSDWLVNAFAADNFKLDYTIDSIIEVDRFFKENMQNGQPRKGGRLAKKGYGPILFSIGSYVGETIIKNVQGSEWVTDDNDPQGEHNVLLKLPNSTEIWPIQKVMKRFQNGSEDAIYPYVHMVTKELINHPFNEQFWTLAAETEETEEGIKRKAYLEGLKLKNSGLDEETIYAILEKKGIPDKLAKQVAKNVMIERTREIDEQVAPLYNIALIRIGLGVVLAIISIFVFPGKIILPIGIIAGGIISALLVKKKIEE